MDLECLTSDRRQFGGMLLAMGICVTFQPLAGFASLVNFNEDASLNTFENIWLLSCGILQITVGTLAMVVGYLALVHDYGSRRLIGSLLLMIQLLWIPFVTGIIEVGMAARPSSEERMSDSNNVTSSEEYTVNPFVPEEYLPNKNDVLFIGVMGMLGLFSYGVGFFGSLAFPGFALYAFDTEKATQRDGNYYRGRLLFYSFIVLIAGMSQILLGAYVFFEFGGGPLNPPIGVAMYRVTFPEITMTVGSIQMVVGYFGVANYLYLFPVGPKSNHFQIVAFLGWIFQLILQYIVQIGYGEGIQYSAELISLALYSVGMNVLPPFLDYKMRTTPTPINRDYDGTTGNGDDKIEVSSNVVFPDKLASHIGSDEPYSRVQDNSGSDHESSDSKGSQRLDKDDHISEPEISQAKTPDVENLDITGSQSSEKGTGGLLSRLFRKDNLGSDHESSDSKGSQRLDKDDHISEPGFSQAKTPEIDGNLDPKNGWDVENLDITGSQKQQDDLESDHESSDSKGSQRLDQDDHISESETSQAKTPEIDGNLDKINGWDVENLDVSGSQRHQDNLGSDHESSDSKGSQRLDRQYNISESETGQAKPPETDGKLDKKCGRDEENLDFTGSQNTSNSSSKKRKGGMFSRLVRNFRTKLLDRGEIVDGKPTQQIAEAESMDYLHGKQSIECSIESGDVDKSEELDRISMKLSNVPKENVEISTENSRETGITVEEIVEYAKEPRITVEETVEYPNNTLHHTSEPGITVEEFVEYPDDLIGAGDANDIVGAGDVDDQDTPPRSNESFRTDMEDTWGEQARQQIFLSSIKEEDSNRMVFGDQIGNIAYEGQEVSLSRHPIDPSQIAHTEDHFLSSQLNSSVPDSYYDYDSDEGYEISEATPDDDTAALDAKIDKLKGELISDTNLESYLNRIL